jgi:hypothetical protein
VDAAGEASYAIEMENTLYGVQFGGRADYSLLCNLRVYAAPRFGVYLNHIEHRSALYSHAGEFAFDIRSDKDDASFLGQLDLGIEYQVTSRLRAFAAYRAVAVSGLGLSVDQIPYQQDDLVGIRNIDTNADLILHGAMAGAELRF